MWRQRSFSSIKYWNFKSLEDGNRCIKVCYMYNASYPVNNFTFNKLKEMLGFQIKNKKVAFILFAICIAAISIGVLIISNQ